MYTKLMCSHVVHKSAFLLSFKIYRSNYTMKCRRSDHLTQFAAGQSHNIFIFSAFISTQKLYLMAKSRSDKDDQIEVMIVFSVLRSCVISPETVSLSRRNVQLFQCYANLKVVNNHQRQFEQNNNQIELHSEVIKTLLQYGGRWNIEQAKQCSEQWTEQQVILKK